MKNIQLLISFILYTVAFFILFPYNRFNIDADGIAYIQEARQYVWGNYFTALNGCWSPLISWILIPFLKLGIDPVLCCKYINGVLGAASLFSFYSLTQKFYINSKIKVLIPFIFTAFTLASAFKLLGPDVLQTFLLSIYLNVIFSKHFIYSNKSLILCGLAGALCYYAKAYNFFFFILHISVVLFILCKKVKPHNSLKFYLSRMMVVFIAFVVFTSPYIILLTYKYKKFTISSASLITINKSLEPSYTDGRKLVVLPPNPYGLSISDDPTYFQKKYITPLTSSKYFFKQIKITLWNIIDFFRILNEISIFSITILLTFCIYLYYRYERNWQPNEIILLTTTILYPSGYLLIALEWRYIWLIPVMLLLMASIILSKVSLITKQKQKSILKFITPIILLSFLLKPIKEMRENITNKTDVYNAAKALKLNGITGNFFAPNSTYLNNHSNYFFCYLNNLKMYGLYTTDYTTSEILVAAMKYHVKYFFSYYQTPAEKEYILKSDLATNSIKVFDSIYPGIIVFQLIK